jgi:hypothetical protein
LAFNSIWKNEFSAAHLIVALRPVPSPLVRWRRAPGAEPRQRSPRVHRAFKASPTGPAVQTHCCLNATTAAVRRRPLTSPHAPTSTAPVQSLGHLPAVPTAPARSHHRLRSVSHAAALSDADHSARLTRSPRQPRSEVSPGPKPLCCPRPPPRLRPDNPHPPVSPCAAAPALRPCRPSRIAGECRHYRRPSCRCPCRSAPRPRVRCASAGRAARAVPSPGFTRAPCTVGPRPSVRAQCGFSPLPDST